MTASQLLTAGTNAKNDLGECLRRHLSVHLAKDQGGSDWGKPSLDPDQLKYAADDVRYLAPLKSALVEEIEKHGLTRALNLEQSLIPVVVDMEVTGIAVDREKLMAIRDTANAECRSAETAIHATVDDASFNPGSPAQLKQEFENRGVSLTDTREETLAGCNDPLAAEVLKRRASQKCAQQAETLLENVGADGRIHGSFNPMGTQTGRFSSSDPNLQNVGRGPLRECLIAPAGKVLIVADYSQIELRAAASIAKEERMLKAYAAGADLHRQTAALVRQKDESAIESSDRQLAKAVNFGLLYGQSAKGLVRYAKNSYAVELTVADAVLFRRRFFHAYPGLQRWHQEAWSKAHHGVTEVRTLINRRRLLPEGEKQEWHRFTGLVNTVVQGSCADGLKLAMVQLAQRLPSEARMISTVHDELIVEAPESNSTEILQLVKDCMIEGMKALFPDIPIEVEAKVCRNWGEK